MGAISALSTAGRTLQRNGVLFGAAFVVASVNIALTGAASLLPPSTAGVVSLSLSGVSLFLTPFFVGGLIAMAYQGLDGTADFGTFVDGGKANYLRLVASMVLFGVLLAVVWVAVVFAGAVVAVFAGGMNAGGAMSFTTAGGHLLVFALVGLTGLFALLLPAFFLQFYAPAIVVSDLGIAAAFKRSASLVRRNLVSALGYTLASILVGGVAGAVGVVVTMVGGVYAAPATPAGTPELETSLLVGAFVVTVIVTTLASAFGATYQVAFYDDRLDSLA